MATKRTKQTVIEKATNSALGLATKANDFALNTTEKVFEKSFKMANTSIDLTSKIIKKGLDISATQQNMVFDMLSGVKKRIVKS